MIAKAGVRNEKEPPCTMGSLSPHVVCSSVFSPDAKKMLHTQHPNSAQYIAASLENKSLQACLDERLHVILLRKYYCVANLLFNGPPFAGEESRNQYHAEHMRICFG